MWSKFVLSLNETLFQYNFLIHLNHNKLSVKISTGGEANVQVYRRVSITNISDIAPEVVHVRDVKPDLFWGEVELGKRARRYIRL